MIAKDRSDMAPNLWSARIAVAQIPETGLHRDIEADRRCAYGIGEDRGLARQSNCPGIVRSDCPGAMTACMCRAGYRRVSDRPAWCPSIRSRTTSSKRSTSSLYRKAGFANSPRPSMMTRCRPRNSGMRPEPIINGVIDLGRLATDVLFLGIDPYPRKSDAVFVAPASAADPEDHPFAALKRAEKRSKFSPARRNRRSD